jgi:hypothetical protein
MVFSGTILVCTYGVSPQFGVFFVCNATCFHHPNTSTMTHHSSVPYPLHKDFRLDELFDPEPLLTPLKTSINPEQMHR